MTKSIFSIFLILFLFSCLDSSAQMERRHIRSGNESYAEGNYDKASEEYMKALDKNKASKEAIFNMGNTLYKQGQYKESEAIFAQLAQSETDTLKRAENFYNLGNTLFQQKRYEDAVKAYKNSLRLNPSDNEAKFNLAYAQEMLKKDNNQDNQNNQNNQNNKNNQNQNDQNNQNDKDKNDNNNDKNNQDNQNNNKDNQDKDNQNDKNDSNRDNENGESPGGMSRDEAERMLDLMQGEEDRTSDKVNRDRARAVGVRNEKNW